MRELKHNAFRKTRVAPSRIRHLPTHTLTHSIIVSASIEIRGLPSLLRLDNANTPVVPHEHGTSLLDPSSSVGLLWIPLHQFVPDSY